MCPGTASYSTSRPIYPDLHGDLDGVSFGLNFGPDPIVNYSSSAFSQVERLPVDFFSDLSFSNGTLLPGSRQRFCSR